MTEDLTIPPDMAELVYWGTAQLERIVPYSGKHILKMSKDGKFPAPFTIGGKNFWRPDVVKRFLREAMSKSEAQAA